ncbi:MAG: 2-dehydro-3-deoxy-D-gluconate 5-dehydrogenase KduD [Pseudomonadota bacterium]
MSGASPFDLAGKRALVTGANTGLGQGIAVALAEAGADIVLAGRSSADDTQAAIEALGRTAVAVRADLADMSAVKRLIADSEAAAGPLDILVNNAGIIRRNDALAFDETDWDDVLDVNLKAVFFLSQAFAQSVVTRGAAGKIVNIASMLSYQGGIRVASYTASKSAVMGLTRILANEWAAKSINVNAIAPGYFATNNTAALQADETRNREILARIPVGRWGEPQELGGAAVFLSSAAADYVHGITLPVDGGWLAR